MMGSRAYRYPYDTETDRTDSLSALGLLLKAVSLLGEGAYQKYL